MLVSPMTATQHPSDVQFDPETVGSVSDAPPFLVVGVGASAGGLEAFTRLIHAIPANAHLALIFVQHLSRWRESLLPHILASKTALQVDDGVDGQAIQPGHLYVITPNTHIAVLDGVLRVRPRPEEAVDAPIDHLLDSMALHYGDRAVGVLLSGGGHDGAFGLQRIRAAGGVTMVQEPAQAQVDSMPRSAIATGAVELVLPAERIAEELVRLAEHPFFVQEQLPKSDRIGGASDAAENLQAVIQALRDGTGVDFGRYKEPTLRRRIRRRMALHRLTNLQDYLQVMQTDRSEVERLHDDILIHVTSFFRDPESFDALKTSVLSQLVRERAAGAPIRAWVPGCSSGEEAYSLAIAILECLGQDADRSPVLVFGTDLSQKVIARARAGVYPESIANEVAPDLLKRHFTKLEDGGYRVSPKVRERCVFARQDITRDPPFSKLDIVMCRNVLIYLSHVAQGKVIGVFHYALTPGGTLMLGRSETVGPHSNLFSLVDGRWKIYSRPSGPVSAQYVEFSAPAAQSMAAASFDARLRRTGQRSSDLELQVETNRILLDRFAPPTIVVDDKLMIVRSYGSTSAYLELPSGEASLDVLKMVRTGLMSPLRNAIQSARDKTSSVRKEGLEYVVGNSLRVVNLEVVPVGRVENRHFLVILEEPRAPAEAGLAPSAPVPLELTQNPAVAQLQQELADTRVHLQAMIQELETANEELQAANEEVLSSNEELQSTNEELDTAREELQSSNEELSTVNDELQARNGELSRANSDLINLLGSVEIPILMVTHDLKIRAFTPAAERTLNLIPSDIGRPIGHIRPNVRYPDLERVMRDVIQTLTPIEREVDDGDGNTFIARIRPYKSVNHCIDGAVLALFDISSTLKAASDTGEAVMSTVRDAVLLLDSNLVTRRVNPAFRKLFGVSEEQALGVPVFELVDGQWNIPELRRLLEDVLPHHQNFQDFALEHRFPSGTKRMLLDGRRIESAQSGGVILLIFRESEDDQA